MPFIRMQIIAAVILIITGCSTTGGTVGGLFPAPKFLKGEVRESVYYAADNSFEIKTPFAQDSYAYKYMEVKEQYYNNGAYVSFNSSVNPNEIYRVEIGKKQDKTRTSPPFEKLVEALLQSYKTQLAKYGSDAKEMWRTNTKIDGKRAVLITMSQAMPTLSTYQGQSPGYTAYHILYVVESPNGGGGAVWVQWPHTCSACLHGPEAEILSTDERIKSFIESFRLKV